MSEDRYLIIGGHTGWIGGKLQTLLTAQGKTFFLADARTQNRESVEAEIEKYKPTHVLNAAGVTGRPNVDWCEDNKQETIRANVLGTLTVADICAQKGVYHLLYATGCIFEYDDKHPLGGPGFTEEDQANFHASFYSHTKAVVEDLLRHYPTTCTLRVRMPISDDLSHRNFVTKVCGVRGLFSGVGVGDAGIRVVGLFPSRLPLLFTSPFIVPLISPPPTALM